MCHYCTQVISFLKRAHAAYHERDLTIVTINVWAEGGKLIRRYKEQFGLPFRMLAGKDQQLLRNYEVNYVPILVFIGKEGRVRYVEHHYILPGDFDKKVDEIVLASDAVGRGVGPAIVSPRFSTLKADSQTRARRPLGFNREQSNCGNGSGRRTSDMILARIPLAIDVPAWPRQGTLRPRAGRSGHRDPEASSAP